MSSVYHSLLNEQFYYSEDGKIYGPLSIYELAFLEIGEDSLVSIRDYRNFTLAKNIPDLLLSIQHIVSQSAPQKPKEEPRRQSPEREPLSETDYRMSMARVKEVLLKMRDLGRQSDEAYTKVFSSVSAEQDYYLEEYERNAKTMVGLLTTVEQEAKLLATASPSRETSGSVGGSVDSRQIIEDKDMILWEVKNGLFKFNEHYKRIFSETLNTAEQSTPLWDDLSAVGHTLSAPIYTGSYTAKVFSLFGEMIAFKQHRFLSLFDHRHLKVEYNRTTRQKAIDYVNAIIVRSLASFPPGLLKITMIDAEDMSGTSEVLKTLSRDVLSICSRNETIRQRLADIERRMEAVIQNLLRSPISSLRQYNEAMESKEHYNLIVIKDFPSGINAESLQSINRIMKNGIRAGVNIILLQDIDTDAPQLTNEAELTVTSFADYATDDDWHHDSTIDIFSEEAMQHIVSAINQGLDVKKDTVYSLSDYMKPEQQWWQRRSEHQAEIAFGLTPDKQRASLKITQESGQNSAIVIGIPGSGKSVFLHTMILNAVTEYSPDELQLYLVDFSGVEFNVYARHRLPHARVIAPEAEREFGLSILRELAEEGHRRMELCRNNDASNIAELRQQCPNERVPRLLVVIDEFQKLFEIENDAISREANRIIHIIIQEYRKFAINLVLATQRLPASSILPRDLIANRIVFRSSPTDFSQLISLQSNERPPQLATGECIYNAESGSPFGNTIVKTFFTPKRYMDQLLSHLADFAKAKGKEAKQQRVFSSTTLPSYRDRKVEHIHQSLSDIPDEVGIYLGESIAISEHDVCARLRKQSNNNLLIIGGEAEVAEGIALHATLSATMQQKDQSAIFGLLNFMRQSDRLSVLPQELFSQMPFTTVFATKQDDVVKALRGFKEIIDERKKDEEQPLSHVYVSVYAFQLARMFDMEGRRGDDPSESGSLLAYILKNGPSVGVFTILQTDNLPNLMRLGTVLPLFEHRVVLQMEEQESNRIMGSSAANKLYDINRPGSRYRAYYYSKSQNITIKFKPYKI